MEILNQGRRPEDNVFEARCKHCRTEVRFKQSEGTVFYDQRDGDYIQVVCPTCNLHIETALNRANKKLGER